MPVPLKADNVLLTLFLCQDVRLERIINFMFNYKKKTMSKKCLKCGCIISDDSITDYCFNCSKSLYSYNNGNNVKSQTENITKEDNVYTREEKVLIIVGNITLWLGIISSIILMIKFKFPENVLIILSVPITSIVSWAILLCIAKTSKNIREIRNK